MSKKVALATAGLMAAFALPMAGCGDDSDSDQDKAQQAAEDYMAALGDKDEEGACELQISSTQTGSGGCTLHSDGQLVPDSPEVDDVELNDDRANANVTGSNGSVVLNLVKEDGDWKVEEYQGVPAK